MQHVDAYAEYRRIVGDDDGGTPFSPSEYQAYLRDVVPMRIKNRLYVSWQNPSGMDCKLIGPETKCLCQCRYKAHESDVPDPNAPGARRLPCKTCSCKGFRYVYSNGPRQVKCSCKHDADLHKKTKPYKCLKCSNCSGFASTYRCGCGEQCQNHKLVVETKIERKAMGKPVGQDVPYKGMGGLTGFSSLMDGYARADPSGIGDLYRALEN